MPVSHRFSRRAAAIGAALALAALPLSATFTPALAQPSPTPTAEASSNAETGASAGADSDSGDDAGSTADSKDGADGNTKSEGGADSDPDPGPTEDGDKACKDQEWTSDEPCAIEGELVAEWKMIGNQLSVPENDQDDPEGTLPKSWVGKSFKAPEQAMKRIPAQSSDDDADTGSTAHDADTDDSGQSVAEATAEAAPTGYHFNEEGQIVAEGQTKPMNFEEFAPSGPDPAWTFTVNDAGQIVAEGEQYPDTGDGADADGETDGSTKDGSKTGNDNGTADNGSSSSADGVTAADGSDSNTRGDKTAGKDGSTSDDNSEGDREASKDGSTSDSDTSDDSTSSTDGGTSSDSGTKDRANTSGDKDSDGRESDADTGSGSDGSRSSDSDSSGSDSDSDEDEEKDSDKDGSGSPIGASDADGTTPDPANGNGSPDERETIPGNAGDEWLPGDDEDSERPDYSDPVPRNPDEQTPKDDTDLITGGDQPSPRANQNPATSFGESIISTIVSSWPIFVLAASGMAAVGFIIYIMGRRGKQD
ncbi:hypothetical protein [Brevibacterium sp. CFH 10365]|uniref:hypothetical protein n=1 Tax=Brevibacterium sp. CFH 10365 TaxID=2585207 RepID=UPI001266403B|nr:hypothetical protein [Brevibacterium sp. CFH 10365]